MPEIAREGKEKQVVGPHVVEPVHSPIHMHSTVRDIHGHFDYQWECKYCGEKNLTIEGFASIHKDCDGIEWKESELVEFKEEVEQ